MYCSFSFLRKNSRNTAGQAPNKDKIKLTSACLTKSGRQFCQPSPPKFLCVFLLFKFKDLKDHFLSVLVSFSAGWKPLFRRSDLSIPVTGHH